MSYATKKEKSALRDLLRKIPVFDKKGMFLPVEKRHITISNDKGEVIKSFIMRNDPLNEMIEYYLSAD